MIAAEKIADAVVIRAVEEALLRLFAEGKLNGTVHTCVGQEFSAVAFAGQLTPDDIVFSNHRCHGHYIAYTKDYRGLIAELMGKADGTCGGIGSSQHLCHGNFYSNGVQGGIVPVAAGMALGIKLAASYAIGVVFIGDGTLGEGVVYETLNIASKRQLPLLIVCENNYYAQSTPQHVNLAGDILKRAAAFDIETRHSNVWQTEALLDAALTSIDFVRSQRRPLFHLVDAYRLNPHSKGDDDRDVNEIDAYRRKDPLQRIGQQQPDMIKALEKEIQTNIDQAIADYTNAAELAFDQYVSVSPPPSAIEWAPLAENQQRQVAQLNQFFREQMRRDERIVFIGEDILSPYGGAFKIANALSTEFPERVISTPISEAAITGIANGLALCGWRPILEIMFGDFMTLCMDQIINHAAKFHHMYNKQVRCPIIIRTPMGGRRGYGPTHSQTLDKFLVGIDHVSTVALNILLDAGEIYGNILAQATDPVIVIENKLDYGKKNSIPRLANYVYEKTSNPYPVVRIRPLRSVPNCTLVTYGGMVDHVLQSVATLFSAHDLKPEILVLSKLHPLDCSEIIASVTKTRRLYVIEEGSAAFGIGAEILALVAESGLSDIVARRITALPVPIPSVRSLESLVLPDADRIIATIKETLHEAAAGNPRSQR